MIELSDELKVVDDEYWENYPNCPEGGGLLDSVINSEGEGADESADPQVAEEEFEDDGFIYEETQTFISQAELSEDQNIADANIAVSSGYFMSRVTVRREEISLTQYTTLFRDNTGAVTALQRSRGGL